MVSGSIAAILYGEPRLTHDVDFVVFLTTDDIRGLQEVFVSADYHVPPMDVIATEIAREQRGHFNIIHYDTGFKADFYTSGCDELHSWAFRRVRRMEYRGEPIIVAPPEYVIITGGALVGTTTTSRTPRALGKPRLFQTGPSTPLMNDALILDAWEPKAVSCSARRQPRWAARRSFAGPHRRIGAFHRLGRSQKRRTARARTGKVRSVTSGRSELQPQVLVNVWKGCLKTPLRHSRLHKQHSAAIRN